MDKLQELIRICKKYDIALCYLFGSQKDNALKILKNEEVETNDPLTDIDVGIVFNKNMEEMPERYDLYSKIYNEMEDIFKPYKLDLVFLQECHSVFQFEAIKGIRIFSISKEFKDNYEMMILRKSADFKYVLDKFYEEALEEYGVKNDK